MTQRDTVEEQAQPELARLFPCVGIALWTPEADAWPWLDLAEDVTSCEWRAPVARRSHAPEILGSTPSLATETESE